MSSLMDPKYFVDHNRGGLENSSLGPINKEFDDDDGPDCIKKKKDESVNIDIKLILGAPGKMGHGKPGCNKPGQSMMGDEIQPDWKSIADQLLQSVSLMDTQTDAVEGGSMDPMAAIDSMDQMTSRILWGKQEDSNPLSSYQNANYGESVAAGLNMKNPAELFNNDAYGANDPDHDGDFDINASGQLVDDEMTEINGEPDWKGMCLMLMDKCGIKSPDAISGATKDSKPAPAPDKPKPVDTKPDDTGKMEDEDKKEDKNPFGKK